MTVREAVDMLKRAEWASLAEREEARAIVEAFAVDTLRMLDGLAAVSFPIPATVKLSLDPADESALYITTETARRLLAALNVALEERR